MMASRIVIVLAFILGISVPIQSQPSVDFGFSVSSFSGIERGESYKVQVKFFSGVITTGFIYNLSLDLSNGTASSSDVTLSTTRGRFLPGDVDEPKDVEFSLTVDNIAQESNETFAIVLHTNHFSAGATIRNRLDVVIIDSDEIIFQLSEVDYTQNEEPNALMDVLITKESGIQLANPVYFRITPLTVEDALNRSVIDKEFEQENPDNPVSPNRANYKDFDDSVIYVIFPTDRDFVELTIPIVDDEIDEADEQIFIIFLEVVNATNNNLNILENREISVGRIIDNEIIKIGFERQSYEVNEPNVDDPVENITISKLVYLIREDNRKSEQTYSVDLTVGDPGGNYKPAQILTSDINKNYDYSLGSSDVTKSNIRFTPTVDRIAFVFILNPDLAVEGTETFRATSAQVTPSGDFPAFQVPTGVNAFASTLIHIIDNDELKVGFEKLNYTVSESDGTVEVCANIINPPEDADLDVMLTLSASTIDGTAGAGSDFTGLRSTSLEFPSSPASTTAGPRRECFNVTITDDNTPENTESFSLFLQENTEKSKTGAIISPNQTEIFILDKDEVVIGFLSQSYSVSESDGIVSILFGVITGSLGTTISISVQLSLSDGSALSGNDYTSTERVYILTGRETVTVDIRIIEDGKFEHAEVFYASLSFVIVPPRVTLQPDRTQITIVDADALIFSFRASAYNFMENIGTHTVYVDKISGSTDLNITLRVSGFLPGGNQLITFSPLDSEKSITLNIPDDSIALEPPETFTLILTAITISGGIMLQPNDKTDITILDDDELIIGFAGGVSVPESENATLSITFSSAFATNFSINIGPPKNDSLISLEIAEPDEDYFLPDFTVEAISSLHNADSSLYFDVFIIQDEFLEYEECFVTAISLPNSVSEVVEIAGGKDTALVCIENDDRVTISFDRVMYSFNENAGSVNISASLVEGELKKTVEVLFNTLSGTATSEDPKDFQSLHRASLQFDELMIQNEVSVTIINDNIFEDEEIFFASLVTNDADVDFGNNNATITIVDDGDVVRFGFGPVQYMVNEGAGSVTLFVLLLEGTLEREVSLQFSTVEGTAMTSDYQTVTRTITFPSMTRNVSVTVTIFDDGILESTENFLVNLADPLSQNGVSIMPSTANVNITDNDGVTIGFEHATYSVDEGDVVEVCAVLNGTLQKLVEVFVSSSSGSATANGDYNPVVMVLTFDQAINRACFNVTTVEDQTLEKTTENLNLDLSTLARNVTLFPDQAQVSIHDDDSVTFGLKNTSLTLNEEGSATARVCIIVTTGTLGRDVIVTLNTMDGTATSVAPADFVVPPNSITFKPGDNEICQNISILDDTLYEEDESFSALLSTGDSSADIDPSQRSATIIIMDTDEITIGFTRRRDMVEEDVDNITICVEVKNNGMLEKSITVQLDTVDGTATVKEDYNSTSHTLEFTPNNERDQQCRDVNILSDDDSEGTETFMTTLSTGDDRVFLDPDTETIFIVDDDVVNIVFIGGPFESREDNGFVAITVGVMDPDKLKTEVSVNLTTEDIVGISNAATAGVDYRPLAETLTFSESVTVITVNITLLDDNTLEGDEDFNAKLSTISGSNVGVGPDAIITIVDDDRVTLGLKDTSLTLNEEGGATARVCVIVTTGTLERDVIVTLNTMDGTATSIDPTADFVGLLNNITFTPGDREICQDISILDDALYEEDENFSALLSTGDSSVDIDPSQQSATIIIMDTDEITIGFTRERDMVEEDVDTAITICVEIKNNGTLKKSITVQFDTVDGTAKANEDYNSTSYSLVFTPDNEKDQQCRAVNILSDDDSEGTETFMATLFTRDDRVSLNPDTETIFIVDDDVVNILFIGDPFEGRENSGFVAITVGVMEPEKLKTEVLVNLTTEDIVGISNAATASVDYRPLAETLTFSETVTVITVNITLLDDNALEGDEDFKAQLSTSSGSNVGLPVPDAIITIVDTDSVIIGFEEETVQVNEGIGMKTLCVNVSHGQLARTTTVSVSSQDQTAIINKDYSFQQMTFTLSKDNTRQCFNVDILDDDDINEPEEKFLVMLTTGDPQVTLSPNTATITIIDNDVAVNDTIIGDPLFTVPILVDRDQREMLNMTKPQLCYEIHGEANQWFNLVTDNCTTVNALYTPLNDRLNVITKIGVKAVDGDNKCVEILVDRSQCTVNVDGTVLGMESYSSGNINVRRYSKRARISVPNCNDINLIMWVICEERTILDSNVTGEMLKFVVLRGLNYGRRAHGLLGQFWNVPVDVTPYTGRLRDNTTATDRFNINVKGIGRSSPRSFTGWLYDLSWDHVEEPCLYVGNKQAGPIHEAATPNDGVIENMFKDYKVASAFSEENYVFGLFNCPDVGSGLGPMQP